MKLSIILCDGSAEIQLTLTRFILEPVSQCPLVPQLISNVCIRSKCECDQDARPVKIIIVKTVNYNASKEDLFTPWVSGRESDA